MHEQRKNSFALAPYSLLMIFLSSLGFPYDGKGCLVNWPTGTPIYECNSNCQCDTSCRNRVLQKGVTVLMEVYKTKSRGWGVRCLEPIPRGKFVCEYTGEVSQDPIWQKTSFFSPKRYLVPKQLLFSILRMKKPNGEEFYMIRFSAATCSTWMWKENRPTRTRLTRRIMEQLADISITAATLI